jgi:hypothetical protein
MRRKWEKHIPDVIFGILSGSGLFFIVSMLFSLAISFVPILQNSSIAVYILLYLVLLVPTSVFYSKGLFRIIYLTSSLILLLAFIYAVIF